MTTANDILDYYNESNHKMQEIRQAMAGRVKADIVALFDFFPALNEIVLRGYTPGFNDGEPCTHSMEEPYLNGRNNCGDTMRSRYESDDEDEEGDENDRQVDALSKPDRKVIAKILGGMTDAIGFLYDTNFEVTATRKADGSVTVEKGYYDCGY